MMTLGMFKDGDCLGAFKVTVYDQFGDMSVTNWGDEVSCEDIQDITELYSFNFDTSEKDTNEQSNNPSSRGNINGSLLLSSLLDVAIIFILTIML